MKATFQTFNHTWLIVEHRNEVLFRGKLVEMRAKEPDRAAAYCDVNIHPTVAMSRWEDGERRVWLLRRYSSMNYFHEVRYWSGAQDFGIREPESTGPATDVLERMFARMRKAGKL